MHRHTAAKIKTNIKSLNEDVNTNTYIIYNKV